MAEKKFRVAVIGCGRMGQHYAEVYRTLPNTEIVAIAEYNPDRRKAVGERFGVKALFQDAQSMLRDVVPDVAAVVLPVKYMKDAVIACAQAGVKGVSCDKPIAAKLSDADEMVEACKKRSVVFAGGNLQRAMSEVQEAARWIRAGEYGKLIGASVHRWGGEISGGGCQHVSVLRLFTSAEVSEVIAWGKPAEAVAADNDSGLIVNALFRMSNGLECPVFGEETPSRGVDVWSEDSLVHWDWAPPDIYKGFDKSGGRIKVDRRYSSYPWPEYTYLGTSIRSFLSAVETGSELWISGHDLRQALEIAIAAKFSALWGTVPVKLPLKDRSLTLYPGPYRWLGGDATGRSQTVDEVFQPLFKK